MALGPKSVSATGERWVMAGIMAGALLLALLLYSPVRHMFFFFDDRMTILHNDHLHSSSLGTILSENPFRAVVNLTFAFQLHLHRPLLPENARTLEQAGPHLSQKFVAPSQRNLVIYTAPETKKEIPVSVDQSRGLIFPLPPALPFRVFNFLLHFLNSALLLLLLRRLRLASPPAIALAAAIFLLHPLATETVNYITARFTLLALTFSLLAAFFHLAPQKTWRHHFLFGLCFLLALFCKETAVVLPLLLFLLDLARGQLHWRTLGWLVLSGLYLLFRLQWTIVLGITPGSVLPWFKYFLVEQRVWWLYGTKLFFPLHLTFDYYLLPNFSLDLFFLFLNLTLLAAACFVVGQEILRLGRLSKEEAKRAESKANKRSKSALPPKNPATPPPKNLSAPLGNWLWPSVIFLMSVIALAPTSSVIPLSDLVKEDRAYPLLAVVLPAFFLALSRLRNRLLPVFLLPLLFLSLLTLARNQAWRTELQLTADSLKKSPAKSRAVYNYATALKWKGDLAQAMFWYQRALALDPTNLDAQLNLEILQQQVLKLSPRSP